MARASAGTGVDPVALSDLVTHAGVGVTLADALAAAHRATCADRAHLRAAMLALLWHQIWVIDLDIPLTERRGSSESGRLAAASAVLELGAGKRL